MHLDHFLTLIAEPVVSVQIKKDHAHHWPCTSKALGMIGWIKWVTVAKDTWFKRLTTPECCSDQVCGDRAMKSVP